MSQVSRFLRETTDGFTHWCPGCRHAHHIWTKGKREHNWSFDGNVECPTFNPSVRIFIPAHESEGVKVPEVTVCHYFLHAGVLQYCGDCQHKLNGQQVPLPELPSELTYHYGDG